MAMAVAAALDAMNWNELVGSIAGDDTVMCAVRSVDDTILLMDKIQKLKVKSPGVDYADEFTCKKYCSDR